MKKKRITNLLISIGLILALSQLCMTTPVEADTYNGNLVVTGSAGYEVRGSTVTEFVFDFNQAGTYRITGLGTQNRDHIIVSAPSGEVNIILDGVTIDVSGTGGSTTAGKAAFLITGNCTTNITLADGSVNTLKSGAFYAGLENDYHDLTITGTTGTLNATGGNNCAGIGGSSTGNTQSGNITIKGGTVNAAGGTGGAGIGGNANNYSNNIFIDGGTVNATGGAGGAGIGGGTNIGNIGSSVIIRGGTVTATGGEGAAGLGDGKFSTTGSLTFFGGTIIAIGNHYNGESYDGALGGVTPLFTFLNATWYKWRTNSTTDAPTGEYIIGETTPYTNKNGYQAVEFTPYSKTIISIEKTGTSGLVDTYTITYSDNTTFEFTGKKVIVAEDVALNMEVAVKLLKFVGIEPVLAEDGKQAVEIFKASKEGDYDCILMDINMPVMDGYEATKAIRSMNRSDSKTIPIYAMTANAFAEDITAALDCGMNGHIAKPIETKILYTTLEEAFKKYNTSES